MAGTALITGASAGLGREFARIHAALGGDVILTARRENALIELKAELEQDHGVTAHIFARDLATPDGPGALIADVSAAGLQVDVLINNAGFGGQGPHIERDLSAEQAMIDLNIRALVTLTHAFGSRMVKQGGGRILNVGSTAGLAPGPNQAVYFASKAFVNSFSQAVDHEMRRHGVTCTVLVPGYVETEFAQAANLEGTPMVNAGGADARAVAQIGYDAMMKGKLMAFNDWRLRIALGWIVPLLPRRLVLRVIGRSQAK